MVRDTPSRIENDERSLLAPFVLGYALVVVGDLVVQAIESRFDLVEALLRFTGRKSPMRS